MDFVSNVGRRSLDARGSEIGAWIDPGNRSLNGNERNMLYRNLGLVQPGRGPVPEDTEESRTAVPLFDDHGFVSQADRIEDGRAAVFTDIEGDGDLDLLVFSYERPMVTLINQGRDRGTAGNWLHVKLTGTKSNRDAIGARVVIHSGGVRQVREVSTTAGYLAGQSLTCHFGLGDAEKVDRLEVFWPSGHRTVLSDVPANRRLGLIEGRAAGRATQPGGL